MMVGMSPIDKNDQAFVDLMHALFASDTPPNEIQVCPKCHGKLHVSVELLRRATGKETWSMSMHCKDCKAAYELDGYPSLGWNIHNG